MKKISEILENIKPIEGFHVMEWLRGVRDANYELSIKDPEAYRRKREIAYKEICEKEIAHLKSMKFYLDTSIFRGLFDKELQHPTQKLFNFIENKEIKIIYSDVLEKELELAPQEIRSAANEKLLKAEYIRLDEKINKLAETYIKEGILTKKSINDARHIAVATISGVDVTISWNFKHIANFMKIQQYNSINLKQGYRTVDIYSPMAIIGDVG